MPNVKSIISKHNKTVLDPPTNNSERTCNCVNKASGKVLKQQHYV